MADSWEQREDEEQSHPPVAREPSLALGNPPKPWVALPGAQPESRKKESPRSLLPCIY